MNRETPSLRWADPDEWHVTPHGEGWAVQRSTMSGWVYSWPVYRLLGLLGNIGYP